MEEGASVIVERVRVEAVTFGGLCPMKIVRGEGLCVACEGQRSPIIKGLEGQ